MNNKLKALAAALALTLALAGCAVPAEVPAEAGVPSETPAETAAQPADSGELLTKAKPEESDGLLGSFTATDLAGKKVDQSLFKDYKLTMVNVWATFCGPCIREMPELGELSAEYAKKGVRIVGLVSDALDSKGKLDKGQIKTANSIVKKTKANYTHILPSDDLMFLLSQIDAVPTTFFVNSKGEQVGYAYTGAMSKAEWADIIDETLDEVKK